MTTVGVVGAGVMGVGVTQSLLQHGHDVILVDIGAEQLERARTELDSAARMSRLLGARRSGEAEGRSLLTLDYDALAAAEFVVENITENLEMKQRIYPVLDRVCEPECVFAANTSAISITRLASLTDRPDRILGMHFMNPVPLKNTVEVIRGWHTSQTTLDTALKLLAGMGKEGIVVNDQPGFVSNRVLMLTVNEAVYLLQDGVAGAEDVDRIFRECFGHKMGPLETADLIGLDTILYSIQVLHESFNDSKYRPCPLLKRMVDAGLHGRKSGHGFFAYS
jgi:3-hydroxybutyryl-CoA dehydrogenase